MDREVALLLAPLVIAMFAIAAWGWSRIPNDARFRGRLGPTGLDFTVGKSTGFALRLATALAVWLGASIAAARGWSFGQAMLLGSISLIVLLIGQVSAVKRASR